MLLLSHIRVVPVLCGRIISLEKSLYPSVRLCCNFENQYSNLHISFFALDFPFFFEVQTLKGSLFPSGNMTV